MKKILLTIMCFVIILNTTSQETVKNNSEPFLPGWYAGVNGGVNLFFSEGNNFFKMKTILTYFSLLDNAGLLGRVAIGYNFTQVVGIRAMGGLSQHNWPDVQDLNSDGSYIVKQIGAQNLTADLMVNLSNWMAGYDSNRLVDISIFAGGGLTHRNKGFFTKDCITGIGRGGLQGDVRLTNRLDLNLIGELNAVGDDYNKAPLHTEVPVDVYAALTVGLTYRFKEKIKEQPAVPQPVIETKTELADKTVIEPDLETVKQPIEQPKEIAKQEPTPVQQNEEIPSTKVEQTKPALQSSELWVNIFYLINKKDIVNARQKEQIAKVVEYLSSNPDAKIVVSGYADKGTGTVSINNIISKKRAENVTEILKTNYGISADRIQTKWYGGRVQLFKQENMNRLTTVSSEGAVPFKKTMKTAK